MNEKAIYGESDRLREITRLIQENEANLAVLELSYSLHTSSIMKDMVQGRIASCERDLESLRRQRANELREEMKKEVQ